MKTSSAWGLSLVAAVGAMLCFLPVALHGIGIFDEGFIAAGALSILRGDLPLRDFFVIYGPGPYYLSAVLYGLFGESLLVTRLAHVALLAAMAVVLVLSSARLAGGRPAQAVLPLLALLVMTVLMMPNPGYPVVPGLTLLVLAGWQLSRWVAGGGTWALAGASVLVGLVGLLRWDFAVLGFAALGTAATVLGAARRLPAGELVGALVWLLLPGSLLLLMGFVPFILAEGWQRWWYEVPLFHLLEFKHWRNLDVLAPTLERLALALAERDRWALLTELNRLVYAGTPFVLAGLALPLAAWRVWRAGRQSGHIVPRDALALIFGLIVLVMLNQVRVRAAPPQAYPAFVAALPLAAYLLQALRDRRPGLAGLAAALLAIPLLLLPAYFAQGKLRDLVLSPVQQHDIVRAGPVRLQPGRPDATAAARLAAYAKLIDYIQLRTRPEDYIFSGVADTSRLHINDPMLYFLSNRRPATRWIEMEPGLTSSLSGQQEVVRELLERNVGLVVLLQAVSAEPNRTARSNGVHVLDEFVRGNYRESRRFGDYIVMEKAVP